MNKKSPLYFVLSLIVSIFVIAYTSLSVWRAGHDIIIKSTDETHYNYILSHHTLEYGRLWGIRPRH